jgi:hypothetical protein
MRNMSDRQCLCRYYEETLSKVKEENARYTERMKQSYQRDLEEYRGRYEEIKMKIALEINEKILVHIKERHN